MAKEKEKNAMVQEDNSKPLDGSMEVNQKQANKLLKAHKFRVSNGSVDSFVSLKNINKVYPNGVQAVYNFNLDIAQHDFIVLVGPSGCGKSTTLRMVAGLEDITSGYLYIDKVLSNYLPSKDRDISMVFQSYALYPQMTVYDNIAFPLKVRKYHKKHVEKTLLGCKEITEVLNNRISDFETAKEESKNKKLNFGKPYEYISTKLHISDYASKFLLGEKGDLNENKPTILEKVEKIKNDTISKIESKGMTVNDDFVLCKDGAEQYYDVKLTKEEIRQLVFHASDVLYLGQYLDRRPGELSGGQMQRVALGRAIVRNAKLFLMDEPLSNLDAKLRVAMRSEIVRIHESIGATTIYVTHDQTEAMTMATKMVVMSKGWVQQVGVPQDVYSNPKNLFVATFIGSPAMNILEGVYNNNTLILKDGYKIALDESFKTKHDTFYREKIDDCKRMLMLLNLDTEKKAIIIQKILANVLPKANENNVNELLRNETLRIEDEFAQNAYRKDLNKINAIKDDASFNKEEAINARKAQLDKELAEHKTKYDEDKGVNLLQYYINKLRDLFGLSYKKPNKEVVNEKINVFANCCKNLADKKPLNESLKQLKDALYDVSTITAADLSKIHSAQSYVKTNDKNNAEVASYAKRKHEFFWDKWAKKHAQRKTKKAGPNFDVSKPTEFVQGLLSSYQKCLEEAHPIKVGIRPEHIHLDQEYKNSKKTAGFTVVPNVVELLGSELLLHAEWNDVDLIAKIATGTIVKPHTEIVLSMNSEKIHIFDSNSGDTIE